MKFSKPLLNISLGLLVLARELFSVCSAAVDSCGNQCDPGHFCKAYFGFCLQCDKFCSDINDACQATCNNNKVPKLTTSNPTKLPPTHTKQNLAINLTSTVASETTAYILRYSSPSPGGGRDGNHKILPNEGHGLFFGLFIALAFVTILAYYLVKYRRSLKICSFTGVDRQSSDIEMAEIPSRPNQHDQDERVNIVPNPLADQAQVRQGTPDGYALVQADDEEDVINQPGPSRIHPQQPAAEVAEAAKPVQPTSASCNTPPPADYPFQSASIRKTNPPKRECENLLRAEPSDCQMPKKKTPETHRKVTDGTLMGHELAIG